MRFKKGDVIGVVIILALLSLFSQNADAALGCFTQPDFVTNHNGQTGCAMIEEANAITLCTGDTQAETNKCMQDYFVSGVTECSALDICKLNPGTWCSGTGDTCREVNYQAECINRNEWTGSLTGSARLQQPARCAQGCCVCSTPGVCPVNPNSPTIMLVTQEQCQEYCGVVRGISVGLFKTDFLPSQNAVNECTILCQADTPLLNGRISGRVLQGTTPIEGATVQAWGETAQTNAQGLYELTNLPAGNTQVTASHPLFTTVTSEVILSTQSSSATKDFQLVRSATGTVQGTVKNTAGTPVKDAIITAAGLTTATNDAGTYRLLGLPYGQHVITASHPNFESKQETKTISATADTATLDFTLEQVQQGTIKIEVKDAAQQPVPFAAVTINDKFEGFTTSLGKFEKNLPANTNGIQYTTRVAQADYDVIPTQTISLKTAEIKTAIFIATARQRECASPARKPVENFQAQHVKGKEAVDLSWTRPCVEVTSYIITRRERIDPPVTVAVLGVIPGVSNPLTFRDSNVKWGTLYEYSIVAVYTDGDVRKSDERKATITLGNARCQDRYRDDVGFIEFCSDDVRLRQQCNDQNQIIPAESGGTNRDCSKEGTNFFCSTTGIDTVCRNAGVCTQPTASPFGLWFIRDGPLGCYGTFNSGTNLFSNYCTYDNALSGTIFQQCVSCNQITSCADYKTQDACDVNNCRAGGLNDCSWVETSTELKTGFCAEENYKGNDRCSECGGDALFSGTCSSDVCTALGACFARPDETSCVECIEGQNSCSSLTTKNECIGDGDNPLFTGGIYQTSDDICSAGRCAWDETENVCFKDGNADGEDDCSLLQGSNCEIDHEPSKTTIKPDIIRIGSYDDKVTFTATGNPDTVYVCISTANNCIPDRNNPQQRIEYAINNSGALVASATMRELGFEEIHDTDTKRYFIRFYTEDAFSNVEDIQGVAIEADLDGPKITLDDDIEKGTATTPSKIKFNVVLDEPAKCTDKLTRIGTRDPLPTRLSTDRRSTFTVDYTVTDGTYTYEVTCTDDFGNQELESITTLVDLDDSITVKKPAGVIKETRTAIEVETTDPSSCVLIDTITSAREQMTGDGARKKHTAATRTFTPNAQYTNLKVECTEDGGFGNDVHPPQFIVFTVDQAPPKTTLKLSAEDGLSREFNTTEWNAQFISEVTVNFLCKDLPLAGTQSVGFGCDKTFYCIDTEDDDQDCIPAETKPLVIEENTRLCYLSKDKEAFTEIRKCGTITIDNSFGIELIKPKFGISNKEEFDLEISTKIPSAQCKWINAVNVAVNFDSIVAARNIFDKVNDNHFKITKFNERIDLSDGVPREIIVICKAVNGENEVISPPQRLLIGYDTTPPQIQSATAQPQTVTEGNTVTLKVQTNEAAICKYGSGKYFKDLTGKFDGFDDAFFLTSHEVALNVDAAQDNNFHAVNVSCINRGEINSSVAQILYKVDFSSSGTITALKPQGALSDLNVQLEVNTNKIASCEFAETTGGTSAFASMTSIDGLAHSQSKPNIAVGPHNIRIRCDFASPAVTREGIISFIIDRAIPRITNVDDKNVTCSPKETSFVVEAEDSESKVALYSYEMFEKNNITSITKGNTSNNNINVEGLSLDIGSEYLFKVSVKDEAGNVAVPVSSNGFVVVEKNDTRCSRDTPPSLSLTQNTTRTGVLVTMNCRDDIACTNQKYGTGKSCSPSNAYTGPVTVEEDTTFCGSASDRANHNVTISKAIDVPDKDKDGITDDFDKCKDTSASETVDNEGCSTGQVVIDTDKDELEDKWEFQYDADDCPLNPRERDTNLNGIEDGKDDYDNDGIQNKDEQRGKTHPCLVQQKRNETVDTRVTPPVTVEEDGSSIISIIVMVLGFFMIIGGIAFLILMQKMSKGVKRNEKFDFQLPTETAPEPQDETVEEPEYQPLKEAILKERKERRKQEFERKKKIFDAFSEFGESK